MDDSDLEIRKELVRSRACQARRQQPHKQELSNLALARFLTLPEYLAAETVLWYVHSRSELRTQHHLAQALLTPQRTVIPYCATDASGQPCLGLWLLQAFDELSIGKWGILEPPVDRRSEADRQVAPGELDVVLVPGVAYTKSGQRLGNGQGYFDRLLAAVRQDCRTVGIRFESQLVDAIPVEPHDVAVDLVVTEKDVYVASE